jgi:hypothetical protein
MICNIAVMKMGDFKRGEKLTVVKRYKRYIGKVGQISKFVCAKMVIECA